MYKNKKGITLIALVITIIVLLILAGIAISMLSGENGIINKAVKARNGMDEAKAIECIKLSMTAARTNTNKTDVSEEGLKSELDKYFDNAEVTQTGSNNYVIEIDGKIYKINNGQVTTGYEKETITDGVIAGASEGEKVDYKIYGNSVQDGTPTTETPIEIQSVGDKTKNLFDPNAPSEQGFINNKTGGISKDSNYPNVYIYTFEVKPNTTYTYYHNIRNNPTYSLYDKDMNWLNKVGGYAATSGTISPVTFTTTEETKYVKICIFKNKVDEGKGRLNEGTTLIDEPYGKYKIPITISGKNLISRDVTVKKNDLSITVKGSEALLNGNSNTNVGLGYDEAAKYAVLEAGTYTFSYYYVSGEIISSPNKFYIGIRNSNNEWIAGSSKVIGLNESNFETKHTVTFTITETTKVYLSFVGWGTVDNLKFTYQLEKNSTSTEYEPYQEPKTTNIYLNEPLRKVGDYADYIDFKNKKVVRNVKVNDNTGTKTIEESYTQQDPKTEETIELPEILTHKGTNIIAVNTSIKPSKTEIINYKLKI